MTIGLVLGLLWVAFLFAVPRMPTNSPFGFLEAVFLLMLLLLTNAWILLLLPRNWETLGIPMRRFSIALAPWWILALGGTAGAGEGVRAVSADSDRRSRDRLARNEPCSMSVRGADAPTALP